MSNDAPAAGTGAGAENSVLAAQTTTADRPPMDLPSLTGAQKTKLRSLGQTKPDTVRAGKHGLTPPFLAELNRLLNLHELVKLRFEGADRHERAALIPQIEARAPCLCVGTVGHTALFWRPGAEGSKLLAATAD